jgi:multisubunit Na+/H+ antiporter MnhG subunit
MTWQTLLLAVLLGVAVLVVLASCVGVAVAAEDLDRAHYLGPVTGVASPFLLAAVLVQDGPVTSTGAKAILTALALLASGPIVNHALGRAHRIRETGDWRPRRESSVRARRS